MMRFLIVDDDKMGLDVLVQTIEDLFKRAEVFQSDNSDEAERLIRANEFDVVICDQNLGSGKTGLALLDLLRRELGRETPFVLITGDTCHEIGRLLGAVSHKRFSILEKPFRRLDLLGAVSFAIAPAPRN